MKKRLGLIVNPVAGMGGRVGLKGTDGLEVLQKALELGAVPRSPSRAVAALQALLPLKDDLSVITFPGKMGECEAKECGFAVEVLGDTGSPGAEWTSREDTLRAARMIVEHGVDLLLFAGGDGTARDVCESAGEKVPVLGIPAGVKIHSAVFGRTPRESGEVARLFLTSGLPVKAAEVMDIDEDLFRQGYVNAKLYGYLQIPFASQRVQGLKAGSAASEETVQRTIASYVAREVLRPDTLYFVGPGTTTRALCTCLNLEGTLLGVDCLLNGRILGKDLTESQILDFCSRYENPVLIVTPIGGQGFLFGRGNQQISPAVLRHFSRERIMVLCTTAKLHHLQGAPLLLDTGDEATDRELAGYVRLVTGFCEYTMYRVE